MAAVVASSNSDPAPPLYSYERGDRSMYAQSVFTNASTLFAGRDLSSLGGPSCYFVQVKRKGTPLKGRGKGYKDWTLCYATLVRSSNEDNSDILIHLVPSDAGHNPVCPPRVILWLSSSSISLSRDNRAQLNPLQKLLSALSVGHCTLKCYSYVFPDRIGTAFVASKEEEEWSFAGFGLTKKMESDKQAKGFLNEVRKLLGWREEVGEEE